MIINIGYNVREEQRLKKLTLNSETIRNLTDVQLIFVAGGTIGGPIDPEPVQLTADYQECWELSMVITCGDSCFCHTDLCIR
ncbi:MAG: hypothetical protein ABIF77_09750 [bacterium]